MKTSHLASDIQAVLIEAGTAQERYGDYASAHEAYGVLAEEFAELLDAVRMRQDNPERAKCVRAEAIQVAACALRLAEQAGRLAR